MFRLPKLLVAACFSILLVSVPAFAGTYDLQFSINGPVPIGEGDGVFQVTVSVVGVTCTGPWGGVDWNVTIDTGGSLTAEADDVGTPMPMPLGFSDVGPSVALDVPIKEDFSYEGNEETFEISLTPRSGTVFSCDAGTFTPNLSDYRLQVQIVENDPLPQFVANDIVVSEADGLASFFVERVGGNDNSAMVEVFTLDGTAIDVADYVEISSEILTFPPGTRQRRVDVTLVDDGDPESDEQFFLKFANPVGATLGTTGAICTVEDDDVVVADPPDLGVADTRVAEGDEGVTEMVFPVRLSAPAPADVTFAWATVSGTASPGDGDFRGVDTTATIAAGETGIDLVVEVLGDTEVEDDETFEVALRNVQGAEARRDRATGTIENDDSVDPGDPALSIGDGGVPEGDAGTTEAELVVTLQPPAATAVSVSFTTVDTAADPATGTATSGEDYEPTSGTLVFAAGETRKSVLVPVIGDTDAEADETIVVRLENADGARLERAEGTVTIRDDDGEPPPLPELRVDDLVVVEGDAGDTTRVSFVVRAVDPANLPANATIAFDFRTEDGTASATEGDYDSTSGRLLFDSARGRVEIPVFVRGDDLEEGDEFFELVLANPAGATFARSRARALIRDDDQGGGGGGGGGGPGPEPSVVRLVSAEPVMEGDGAAVVVVERVGDSATPARARVVTRAGTARAGEDFVASRVPVTWAAGESGRRQVEIPLIDDRIEEANERFFVGLEEAQGAEIGTPRALPVAVTDDDSPMRLEAVGETERTVTVRSQLDFAVRVVRADGEPVEGARVEWTAEGRARVSRDGRTFSNADGVAAERVVTANTPGPARVRARLAGSAADEARVEFVLRVEGDLRDTVGDDDSNEGDIAETLDETCADAENDPDLAELCEFLYDLDDPADQRRAIENLLPRGNLAQARAALRAPEGQIRNVASRLGAVRGGITRQVALGQLTLALQGDPVALGPLQEAIVAAGRPSDGEALAGAVDRAMEFGARASGGAASADSALASSVLADSAFGGSALGDDLQPDAEADADRATEIDLGGESPWGFFLNGRASFGDAPRRDRDPGYDFETQGLTAGVDYRLSDRWVLGVALGYLRTDTDVQGGGTVDVEGYTLSGYATWYTDSWYLDAVVSYGVGDYALERVIDLPVAFRGNDRLVATAEPESDQVAAHLAFGYDFRVGPAATLTGFARGSWVRAEVDSYVETGAFAFDLAFAEQTVESLLGELGAEIVYPVSRSWGVLQPLVRVSYLHEFEDDPQVLLGRFARDPRARVFRVEGERRDADFFNVAAGVTATFPRGWAGYLQYDTDLERDDFDIYTLSGGFRFQF